MAILTSAPASLVASAKMRQPGRTRCGRIVAVCGKLVLAAVAAALLVPGPPSDAMSAPTLPAPPKRAMNAYMHFSKSRRPALMKANPDTSVLEIGKLMGSEWKKIDAKGKKKFVQEADKDKKRYEKEAAKYVKEHGEIPKRKVRAKKVDSKPKQKRKPSAYNMFIKDRMQATMQKMGTTKVVEAMSALAKEWKGLTTKQQAKYKKQAEEAAVC